MRRLVGLGLLVGVVPLVVAYPGASADPPSAFDPIPSEAWQPVTLEASDAPAPGGTPAIPPIFDPAPTFATLPRSRPVIPRAPIIVVTRQPAARATPKPIGHAASKPARTIARATTRAVPSVGDARAYAMSRIGATQFDCLDRLFQRESGWNTFARNASTGAYGIPQALPGSKMAVIAGDWRYNPLTQVKWGLLYISNAYGTACAAWAHSQATGWY